MAMGRWRLGFSLLGLMSGACMAFGYDFGEYQAAAGSAGASPISGKAHEPTEDFEPEASEGGARSASAPAASPTAHAGQPDVPSAAGADDGSIFTTYAAGGASHVEAPRSEGGAGGARGGGEGEGGSCQPRGCFEAQAMCGRLDDGCGAELDCGQCFWWFEQCLENRCAILLN
jgi:hypothetical protein